MIKSPFYKIKNKFHIKLEIIIMVKKEIKLKLNNLKVHWNIFED